MTFPLNGPTFCRYVSVLPWKLPCLLAVLVTCVRTTAVCGALAPQELVARLGDENYQVINGVLEVCNVLFKR